MGQIPIRGVQCDWWQAQVTWPQLESVFTLNYYFTAQTWQTAAGFTDQGTFQVVPVRAEICGLANKTHNFHHIYDYADFQVTLDPLTTVFETPAGVVCPGRVQTRTLPKLKNAFIYREEIISPSNIAATEADNSQISQNDDGNADQGDSAIPIQLRISVPSIPYSATYNFYNFDQEDAEITSFDVSTCYTQEQQIGFKLTFYGTFDAPVKAYKTIFLLNTISTAAAAAGVSPLRIANAQFYFQPDQAFFVATLLDQAPVLQRYRKLAGQVLQYNNDAVVNNIMDVNDCANLCLSNGNFTCNSFEYCQASSICTLSKKHTNDGTVVPSAGKQCDLYDRTLGGNAYQEVQLQQAWQNLRNAVIKRLVKINIAFDKNTQTYTASDVSNDIVNTDTMTPSATSLLQNYRPMVNRYVPNFDDMILTGMSIDDCAQACNSQETFICNSFEYQYGTSECYLSHLHPDEQPDKIKSANGVDLYIRDYTTKFAETAGTTVLSSSNVIYQGIYDTNNCARLCVDYNEFSCKSFDFCPDIGTCFLGKTHLYDAPKSQIKADPMCNHWSRNYIDDFSYTKRSYIRMTNDRVISGITVQQCAKLCVEEQTFSCASFDYCGNYTECRLTSASLKNVGQVTLESNLYCDVYTRQYFPDGTSYIANPSKYYGTTQAPSTGLSSGAAGGLAFGMIILGIVLTILGIFIYFKVTGKGMDDMRIQFTKQVDEE
ncbi:hypothetical protein FSP39_014480 [Pinctada imbricata]|uniref:Apple domain-containing protein n=1 Tax=Pinctada imbricata TaxID=66713 RepID=A0AA88XS80_PINIB|nr:hypothetical protein FSP39_014480 [Pinctada imbricata]